MSIRNISPGVLAALPALALGLVPAAAVAQGEELPRSVISSGAVASAEPGGTRARATVGSIVGVMTGFDESGELTGAVLGFWARPAFTATGLPGTRPVIGLGTHLLSNVPNPFLARTDVRFSLAQEGRVRIPVYDVTGRLVATITDAWYAAGLHTVRFEPRGLPSGVYFYRMQVGGAVQTRRFLLLK